MLSSHYKFYEITVALTLVLTRHGHAESLRSGEDFDRNLTTRGVKEVAQIPEFLAGYSVVPELCLISPATRTKQTAIEIFKSPALKHIHQVEVPNIYRATAEELLEILESTSPSCTSVMVIGHNPAITALTSHFKISNGYLDKANNFEVTAKTVIMSFDATSWQHIRFSTVRIVDVFFP